MYDYQVCIFLFFFLSTDGKIKIIIIWFYYWFKN
jgi:hypothetical protein